MSPQSFARVWVAVSRRDGRPYVIVDFHERFVRLGPFESRSHADAVRAECIAGIREALESNGLGAEVVLESKGGTA